MKIAVLMGGRSGEHEVSLRSGRAVIGALFGRGHAVFALTFGRHGGATFGPVGNGDDAETEGTIAASLVALEAWGPACAFIAMHGEDGEDGKIQGVLELLGIPYQGSGIQASAIGLDKVRTKQLLRAAGLPLARERVIDRTAPRDWDALVAELGLPLVMKTPASGSSVGVEIVPTREAAEARGEALLDEAGRVLLEQYVKGREFTLPVLEDPDGTPTALPVVEIRPREAAFFDYTAKYTPGATDEICPAPIPPALEAILGDLGLRAHQALGCRGYSRTDCIVTPLGEVALLEVNTLPGLTAESLMPRSAAVAGMDFTALVERLLARALVTHPRI